MGENKMQISISGDQNEKEDLESIKEKEINYRKKERSKEKAYLRRVQEQFA